MKRKPYSKPVVQQQKPAESAVLLACTGQFDCGNIGYTAGCCVSVGGNQDQKCQDNFC